MAKASTATATATKPKPAAKTAAKASSKPVVAMDNGKVKFMEGRCRSPKGTSSFAYLSKPDVKFGPKQKITATFDRSDPEFMALAKTILAFENENLVANGRKPIKFPSCIHPATDKDKQVIPGKFSIEFKREAVEDGQGGYTPVPCVDAAKEPCSTKVYSGSLVRVGFGVGFWVSAGRMGTKCYLNAVQVLEAVEGTGGADSYFDVDESYVTDLMSDVADEGDAAAVVADDVADEGTGDEDDLLA